MSFAGGPGGGTGGGGVTGLDAAQVQALIDADRGKVPEFGDEAAARTGGLENGDIFKTDGSGSLASGVYILSASGPMHVGEY